MLIKRFQQKLSFYVINAYFPLEFKCQSNLHYFIKLVYTYRYMYERNFLRTNTFAMHDEIFASYHVPGPHRDALTRRTNNNVGTLRPQRCKASRARNARITLRHYIMMRECNVASAALESRAKKIRIMQKNAREGARCTCALNAYFNSVCVCVCLSSQGNRRLYRLIYRIATVLSRRGYSQNINN